MANTLVHIHVLNNCRKKPTHIYLANKGNCYCAHSWDIEEWHQLIVVSNRKATIQNKHLFQRINAAV